MKKCYLILAMTAGAALSAQAQAVLGYTVSSAEGTYTPLANPTVIYDASTQEAPITDKMMQTVFTPDGAKTESASVKGYDLGFSASIAGTEYKNFTVSGAGYLYLGEGDIAINPSMKANFMSADGAYDIVGAGIQRDSKGVANTKISYEVTGSGADAVLTVQYENLGMMYAFFGDPAVADMQIRLHADGNVDIVYNNLASVPDGSNVFVFMGIRQGANYVCANLVGDVLSLTRNQNNTIGLPNTTPNGKTYTLKAPGQCAVPTTAASDLQLTTTSTSVHGSFAPAADADTYLVTMWHRSANILFVPQNGTTYTTGQQTTGITVAYCGPNTEFDVSSLPGDETYVFTVYAANSYGLNGPVYNLDAIRAEATTAPAAPKEVVIGECGLNNIRLTVTPNDAEQEVVVLYNPYCDRDNYGDHGLFGTLTPTTAQGDVLPVPEGYASTLQYPDAPLPENAGTVAYIGEAGEINIEGLQPSTGYYLAVLTRNPEGKYSTDMILTGASTSLTCPTSGSGANYPRYRLPFGWSSSPVGDNTFEFINQSYVMRGAISQGTQPIQQNAKLNRGDATNGKEAWLTVAPVNVNATHTTINFSYCLAAGASRFKTDPYNDWNENDLLAIRVSTDQGATWTPVTSYTAANRPVQETATSYSDISADLNAYLGQTVLVQLYLKTYAAPAFGFNAYVDHVNIYQVEDTAAPVATVGKVDEASAVISWTSAQKSYQVAYNAVGSDNVTEINVEDATSCTITGLEAKTAYEVKVRGLLSSGYTEWSQTVTFTTTDYPAVNAPENLLSQIVEGNDANSHIAILSWDPAKDAESYEVAYRISTSTEWCKVNVADNTHTIDTLEPNTTYVWKVRAFCTHDRVTSYSAQARFTTPEQTSGTLMITLDENAEYYDLSGRRIHHPAQGVYMMRSGDKIVKVLIK